jgi:HK97 family phage portal protein
MKVIPSETGMPRGYQYQVGQRKVEWEADPYSGESDIRHLKAFNPLDDWYGLSPIEAGAFAIDQHNESMKWMQALLQNSARPSGALVVGADKDLTPDQFNRLKTEMEENYQGARNAGRPMLLEGGLDWKAMGLSPSDMSIIESKYSSARDVALAFGVPPMLLGIPGDNTYSNYKEARLAFWEDTVLPLVTYMTEELNAWLAPSFGAELRPDLDAIEAIAEKRREMWAMADKSMELTVNEVREIKGYEPLADPLGSMLMAELRKQVPQEDQADTKALLRLAYGDR